MDIEALSPDARDRVARIELGEVQEFSALDPESELYKEVFEYFAHGWDDIYRTREDVYWHLFWRYAE